VAEYVKGTTAADWLVKAREAMALASAAMQANPDVLAAFRDATTAAEWGQEVNKEFSDLRAWLAYSVTATRGVSQVELARLTDITPGRINQLVSAGRKQGRNPVMDPGTTVLQPPLVLAIITSERGVLVAERIDRIPPWTFPGGDIQPGESPADAAKRRVLAETGLTVDAVTTVYGERIHPLTGRHTVYVGCEVSPENLDVIVGDPEDLSKVEWIRFTAIRERMPTMYEPVLEHLRSVLSSRGLL
jgi:8-oxo-dGTP diphosphatase